MADGPEIHGVVQAPRRLKKKGRRQRQRVFFPGIARAKHICSMRGKYRIFGTAEYRFFYSSTGEPLETDTPFTTNATLPHTPADTYGNGAHRFALEYDNGIHKSGFLRLGPNGETFRRVDVTAGSETSNPPSKPHSVVLHKKASGVIRVVGVYFALGSLRAEEWALTYTFNGSDPAEDTPDYTQAMTSGGTQVFDYDLTGQVDGTTVKVRLQTRRNDGSWVYSETDSTDIFTETADATGPSAPPAGDQWKGSVD
jgi:hypothetical protein